MQDEVQCSAAAPNIADCQNAHSMTAAVQAIVKPFHAGKRKDEAYQQILALPISNSHRSVQIYSHYLVIDEKDTKHYRHPIHKFSFTALDGKESGRHIALPSHPHICITMLRLHANYCICEQ